MKTHTHDEVLNRFIGQKGTSERDDFDNKLKADVLACKFKELRKQQQLSKKQLAEKVGISEGQISKIENGLFDLTLANINKVANALGSKLNFDLQPTDQ